MQRRGDDEFMVALAVMVGTIALWQSGKTRAGKRTSAVQMCSDASATEAGTMMSIDALNGKFRCNEVR